MSDCIKNILITQIEYEILKCLLPDDSKSFTQAIYYYDTEDTLLNKLGTSCRIEEFNAKHIAYISIDAETEKVEKSKNVKGPFDRSFFSGLNVKYQGRMIIEKNILYKDVLIEISLAKNTYLTEEDYEIDISYVSGQEYLVEHLLFYYQRQISECMNLGNDFDFNLQGRQYKSRARRFFFRKKHLEYLMTR